MTYGLVSLAQVLPLPHVQEGKAARGGSYVTGSHIPLQVEQVVPRSAVSERVWTVGFGALGPLAGAKQTGKCAMNDACSVNARTDLRPAFAGRSTDSLLEIDAWIPSEISAISPLVDRLMRLIEGSHCVDGEEPGVELALREALNNAVVHGNRLDTRKLVHVRCHCKAGNGISLVVSDQGQGFDPRAFPDSVTVENLEADHGRGIRLMKFAMDEVSFEQGGTEVHMSKSIARNPSADVQSESCGS